MNKIFAMLLVSLSLTACTTKAGNGERIVFAMEEPFISLVRTDAGNLALGDNGYSGLALGTYCAPDEKIVISILPAKTKPGNAEPYAVKGRVFIVGEQNSFTSITNEQAEKAASGLFAEWPGVGVKVKQIIRTPQTTPKNKSGVRYENMPAPVLVNDTATAAALVSADPSAIAVLPLGLTVPEIKGVRILKVDGVEPSVENVANGRYPQGSVYYISVAAGVAEDITALYNKFRTPDFKNRLKAYGVIPLFPQTETKQAGEKKQ